MMPDRRKFSPIPSSWAEVYTLISIFLSILGVITWVVKFYAKVDILITEVAEVKTQLAKGVLPVTDEKIRQVNDKVDRIDHNLTQHLEDYKRERLHR